MRAWVGLVITTMFAACTHDPGVPQPVGDTYNFGEFQIAPHEEISDLCISKALNNDEDIFVNSVELNTGPGFHHSNWFFVPINTFRDDAGNGGDGTWKCDDRHYSEPQAASSGGVLFAQSTQAPHERQKFPAGKAIKIPAHFKLVAQIHLLNTGDAPLDLHPYIALGRIEPSEVETTLAAVSFENQALTIGPKDHSRYTLDCDIATEHQKQLGRAPDFHLYYGLAHYHTLGTRLTVEAENDNPDDTKTIFTTENRAGDVLGGPIDPSFDFTGYTRMRFSCEFYNDTANTVRWGIGKQEMCVFLAFSDSDYNWGGGHTFREDATPAGQDGNMKLYQDSCDVYGIGKH